MATKQFYKSRGEHLATRAEAASTWETKNRQPVKKTKEVMGRPIPYMVEETIDQAEITEGFNVYDFTIENLQEIGMDKKLGITYAQLSDLQTIDRLEQGAAKELDRMDSEEWAAKYLKQIEEQQQQPKNKEE